MDIKIKKRIVGLTLLAGAGLIIAPIFFTRSINSDQLRLSAHIPEPPAKPQAITSIKPMPAPAAPQIVFEELHSVAAKEEQTKDISPLPQAPASPKTQSSMPKLATNEKSPASPILLTTVSTPEFEKASIVPLSTLQPPSTDIKTAANESTSASPAEPDKPFITAVAPSTNTEAASSNEPSATEDDTPPPDLEEDSTPPVAAAPAPTPAPKAKAPVTKTKVAPTKPKLADTKKAHKSTTSTSAQAWAVQLGSFSDKINAEKLMKTLQSQGYASYVQVIKTSKGTNLTKVLVGPELRREDAQKIQEKLKNLNANAMLIKVGG